jgi:hypothetical protein
MRAAITVLILTALLLLNFNVLSQGKPVGGSRYEITGSKIIVRAGGEEHLCSVSEMPVDAKLSSDESALIVSGTAYIPTTKRSACDEKEILHPTIAAPHVGFLSDVNLRAGLYTSLMPVAVNPLSFVAVVAHLGSDKNIVTLPGSYRSNVSSSKLRVEGLVNAEPVISFNGRYVAPREIDCRPSAYPGVWDIKKNKRLVVDDESCSALFLRVENGAP